LPNTFTPEGAQRCRALTSGLLGRAVARKESLFESGRIYDANKRKVNKLEHDPEKHVLDLIGGGCRFSEKIMLTQKACQFRRVR
jgi:hypothetical protein